MRTREMDFFIVAAVVLTFFLPVQSVWAGGAVVAQKRARQRMIMEQQVRQAQMLRYQQMQHQQAPAGEEAGEAPGVPEQREHEDQTVRDVVTPQQLISSLKTSGKAWALIIDEPVKEMVVNYFIHEFRQKGVTISKPAAHYVGLIDSMSRQSPQMLDRPFSQILEVVAIIEYDFNNGQNKDAMALKVLGSQKAVEADRQRLGL